MEYESDGDTDCNWFAWKVLKGLVRALEEQEIGEQTKNTQTIAALLRSARLKRRVIET